MDDLEFIQRCVRGEHCAWDEFLKKYTRLIYNYINSAFKLKGLLSKEDHINDIFQEFFHSLIKDDCRKLRSFKARNGCSLASWLRLLTVNFTIDYIRKLKPDISLDEESQEELSLKDILVDASPTARATFASTQDLLALKECIKGLSRDEKYFLELHSNQGVGLQELKDILGVTRGAIDMRKARIMDKLRECFKLKGFQLDY